MFSTSISRSLVTCSSSFTGSVLSLMKGLAPICAKNLPPNSALAFTMPKADRLFFSLKSNTYTLPRLSLNVSQLTTQDYKSSKHTMP